MKNYSFLQETLIQELVKDPEWQKLRQSLVGTWTKTPEENCKKLRQYLCNNNLSKCDIKKLKIVKNYITGTAFRIGKIKNSCIDSLKNDINKQLRTQQ